MIISNKKYCVASKAFLLTFYIHNGSETNILDNDCMMSYKECEMTLKDFDEPENYQILQVKVTFEI